MVLDLGGYIDILYSLEFGLGKFVSFNEDNDFGFIVWTRGELLKLMSDEQDDETFLTLQHSQVILPFFDHAKTNPPHQAKHFPTRTASQSHVFEICPCLFLAKTIKR